MAYTINLTDGAQFATIPDGTLNTASSMVLVGKNYAGYGQFLDQNFMRLLENGSCNATSVTSFTPTAISAPLEGQLWWNKTNGVLCVFDGDVWKNVGAVRVATSAPVSNVAGDLWFDSVNKQLRVYDGSTFILVGPASSSAQGISGAIVATIQDTAGTPGGHVVIELWTADERVAIVSKDPVFSPAIPIAGFVNIGPGIQLSTAVGSSFFRGTSTNAEQLDNLNSTQFLRSDETDSTSGSLAVLNDIGLTVGSGADARLVVAGATREVTFFNQTATANLVLGVTQPSGIPIYPIKIVGTSGQIQLPSIGTASVLSSAGNITAPNFIGNVVGNITGTIAAPGSNTQVLFNDAGNIFAEGGLTFNRGTGTLATGNITVGSISSSGSITVNATGAGNAIVNGAANVTGNIGTSLSYFNTVFANTFQGTATRALIADTANTAVAFSGVLPISQGGTGQNTATAAINALLPTQTSGVANYYLRTDGAGTISWQAIAGGGSVTEVTAAAPLASSGGNAPQISIASAVPVTLGGTSKTSFTAGAILRGNGTGTPVEVVGATAGQVLEWTGSAWAPGAGGGGGGDSVELAGSIKLWGGSLAPTGWAFCDGSAVSRTTYALLFSRIGTTYGAGDGSTTFNLPDMRGRVALGTSSTYSQGSTGGSANAAVVSHSHTYSDSFSGTTDSAGTHTHSISDPGHAHTVTLLASVSAGGQEIPPADATGGVIPYLTNSQTTGISINSGGSHAHGFSGSVSGTTSTAGSSGTNANLPPYISINWIIKMDDSQAGGGGTVTTVTASAPLSSSGGATPNITFSGTLAVSQGGTGASTASGARSALDVPSTSGSGASGTWGINITGSAAAATLAGQATIANRLTESEQGLAPNYAARAWLNYDQIFNVINSSRNISSVTDLATGSFIVSYSSSIGISTYAYTCAGKFDISSADQNTPSIGAARSPNNPTSTGIQIAVCDRGPDVVPYDVVQACFAIFR